MAESGKAYELGPQCSLAVVTNVTACGDGYVQGYNHFVSDRWQQRTNSENLFSYQQGWRTGVHDYDCSYYGGQQESSSGGNGVYNCSNIIKNVCSVDYKLNSTNATSCFNGYVDSWHKFCTFNSTSCADTLNQLLGGHSVTYWAGWQNGKGDGEGGTFDIGGQLPANNTFSQQQRFDAGYYDGYDKYCTKGGHNDNCPAIPQVGGMIPDQDKSLAYNHGFSDGFVGKRDTGHHTQNYTDGYRNGTSAYWNIRGAIIPGYLSKPSLPLSSLPSVVNRSDYLSWYQQAKHFHVDDKFNIRIPSHSNDNYLMYIIGIQDGMLVYDQDNNRENGNTNPPLGHPHQQEYGVGFNDGWDIEHEAEEAD
jgi:hypothetical protein